MDLKQNITVKQQQKLVMSPLMLRSLNILRMPVLELKARLEQELLSNPVIEELPVEEDYEESVREAVENKLKSEDEWEDYYRSLSRMDYPGGGEDYDRPVDFAAEVPQGLQDYLTSQLHISGGPDIALGEFIIGNIDDNGYLRMRSEEIARARGTSIESVERAVSLIQAFDPPGVCARGLGECLLLQAARAEKRNLLAERIINDYLPELQKKQLGRISSGLSAGMEDTAAAVKFISKLNPHPGASFSRGAAPPVSPDVIIKKEGGEYAVSVNSSELPVFRISRFYRNLFEKGPAGEARRFAEKKIKSAEWLLEAVESRKSSLRKVAEYILKAQRGFFDGGGISPARMKDAAAATGLSESTVSRAVSGKYLETDSGIYPMKHFFSGKLDSVKNRETSSASVKGRIAEIIKSETPSNPLSDAGIADLLKREGISIARRTVAKYREAEGILPAALRKTI